MVKESFVPFVDGKEGAMPAPDCDFERQQEIDNNYEFFKKELSELLPEHEGKYILIKSQKFQGIYSDFESAYKAGEEKFGEQPFSIQEITGKKKMLTFALLDDSCATHSLEVR